MQLHFIMRFSTYWGQRFSVRAGTQGAGNDGEMREMPMEYVDENTWQLILPVKTTGPFTLRYKYVLYDENEGSVSVEWDEDRALTLDPMQFPAVQLSDYWNFAGDPGNAFLTAPFRQVLLKEKACEGCEESTATVYTHLFRVKAPLLREEEVVCLTGDGGPLGNWNANKPLLLCRGASQWWETKISLADTSFPLHYKYGVYDRKEHRLSEFETGPNRVLKGKPAKRKLTVVTDGFCRFTRRTWKGAGVAIPVFSIRTRQGFGTGEFADIKLLAGWAKQAGIRLIQVLPVNDTTATHTWKDSYPYAAISTFALHPLYLHLPAIGTLDEQDPLQRQYDVKQEELNRLPGLDYEAVTGFKFRYAKALYHRQKEKLLADESYRRFFEENKYWLTPYAAFCYLRDKYGTADFSQWERYSVYQAAGVGRLTSPSQPHFDEIAVHYFIQYHLHLQLTEAVDYAHRQGIVIKGDIPIGIYRNSVDAWMQPALFFMDSQAGAPPDDFAPKGQNWGFPTYNWEKMEENGFAWWKKRFFQMAGYFDAFRIDHILGFFRIWQIPLDSIEGVMGHFYPAIPVTIQEFADRGIWFDHERYCSPYITMPVLYELFGEKAEGVKERFLTRCGNGRYAFRPEFNSQQKVQEYFNNGAEEQDGSLRTGLFDLASNLLFFEVKGSGGTQFHPRYGMERTSAFLHLERPVREKLKELYTDYFYRRQDGFWRRQAMKKLPAIRQATNMLICGEDLGMVPGAVPGVMKELGILSLEIQRMPKNPATEFFHPKDAPYLSVVTPSSHDMSTIRAWWEEDREKTQRFYHFVLGRQGQAPYFCEPRIVKEIILQHLNSPAMWAVFQVQDLLALSGRLRRENPQEERINIPAISGYYWRYRMHIPLEDLVKETSFNRELKEYVRRSGR